MGPSASVQGMQRGVYPLNKRPEEMPTEILMPALSPTMEEGKLAKWLIEEGQTVKAGDIIAEIETDKATMEVEASDEGKVSKLLVAEGTEGVKVNTPIALLDGEGGAAPPKAPAPSAAAKPPAPSAPPAAPAARVPASPATQVAVAEPAIAPGTEMITQTMREAL